MRGCQNHSISHKKDSGKGLLFLWETDWIQYVLVFFALYMVVFTNQLLCFCRVSKIGHVFFKSLSERTWRKVWFLQPLDARFRWRNDPFFFFVPGQSFSTRCKPFILDIPIGYHLKIYEHAIGSIKIMAV